MFYIYLYLSIDYWRQGDLPSQPSNYPSVLLKAPLVACSFLLNVVSIFALSVANDPPILPSGLGHCRHSFLTKLRIDHEPYSEASATLSI